MKNLIEYILIHIVDNPEDVKVEVETEGNNSTYSITVNEDDMGRVIGKKGSVIQSIRTIARVRAIKEGERARIIVVDTDPNEVETTPEAPVAETETTVEVEAPAAEASTPEVEASVVETEATPEVETPATETPVAETEATPETPVVEVPTETKA